MVEGFPQGFRMFFLREVGELQEHCFRVALTEARTGAPYGEKFLGEIVQMADIEVDPSAASIVLVWEDCAAYAVYADHVFIPGGRAGTDDMLVEYDDSAFLEYVRSTTYSEDITGHLRHWRLTCLQHVIDVAATAGPRISELPAGTVFPLR